MNIAGVEDRAVAVITLLRKAGRATDAHDMARIAAALRSPEEIENALEGIIERCNIRWLGDVPLLNIQSSEWLQALNALENSSRAELLLLRNRSAQRRDTPHKTKQRNALRRTTSGKAKMPWATKRSGNYGSKGRKTNTNLQANPSTALSLRTLSAAPRDRGKKNERWIASGPIERATAPIWHLFLLFLPPFALIGFCVLVIVDSIPDLFPPETVIVEGVVERWELRDNYSPRGVKGVVFLDDHLAAYSIHEALGYGFADSVGGLNAGDSITLHVDERAISKENSRVAQILDALGNADTESEYDVIVSGLARTDNSLPIPILELRLDNEVKYSRLGLTSAAEQRIRNWGFLGLAAFLFIIMGARLRTR